MTRSSFIRGNGTYRSVHGGPELPSPIVLIVSAAWRLARTGEPIDFGPGVNEQYLKMMLELYGQLGKEEILSPVRVRGILKIWEHIKGNPGVLSILGQDKHVIEGFLYQASTYYDL